MDHIFGGGWTEAKLAALEEYLRQYTLALKNQGFQLYYVDAFAGSGTFVPSQSRDKKQRRGSAQRALEVGGFNSYIFIEKGARRCRVLDQFVATHTSRDAQVLSGDANEILSDMCGRFDWHSSRAVLFLDPYGMQVRWETLKAVAATESIDVWYLFPLSGVTRQLAIDSGKLDADKIRSLDAVLGTPLWREAFYEVPPQSDLFGALQAERRFVDSKAISEWITGRLSELFPIVEGPALLRKSRPGKPASGPPLFALYCLIANPSEKAQGLALRIAHGVFTKLRREGVIC